MMAAALTIFQVRVGSSESDIAFTVDCNQECLVRFFRVDREFVVIGMLPSAVAGAELCQVCRIC